VGGYIYYLNQLLAGYIL